LKVKKYLDLLGLPVTDKVSGLKGIITSVSFDLYGCIQAIVHPGLDKDGKLAEPIWLDIARLQVTSKVPVMETPNFEFGPASDAKVGPAEKPLLNKP